jgi:putative transposase
VAAPGRQRAHPEQPGALVDAIRRVLHADSRRRYGSPRVHATLQAEGSPAGRNRVARLMRRHGIRARCRRRFRTTTDSNHALPLAPNLLARQFTAAAPDQVWLADITYIPTDEG